MRGVEEVRSQREAVVSSEQVRRWDRLRGENEVTWTGLMRVGRDKGKIRNRTGAEEPGARISLEIFGRGQRGKG
jgi:hypothetical protein